VKVSFWLTSTTRIMTEENWGKAPMGGAEISAVQLGEEFIKNGHDVSYYLERAEPFDRGNLHIRQHHQIFDEEHKYFICVRPHGVLQGDFGDIKKILWSGDAFDQSSNNVFWNKKVAESMDGFVFKSNWQKEKILNKYYTIPEDKVNVIYNGIKKDYYSDNGVVPDPKRFIHTSTWYRGVHNFLEIWPLILEKIPDAEVHVFSKTSLYSDRNPRDDQGWPELAEKLVHLPGMVLREPVPQNILAQEMKKAWAMLYPNSGFVESSCGSAQQSLAAGTPVIATKRAGLIETIGEDGILIEQNDDDWKKRFAKAAVELSQNRETRFRLGKSGHHRAISQSWEAKAKEWEDYLKSL